MRDFLNEKYDPKKLKLNDRKHPLNICFFPDYFAPESFLYRIIYRVSNAPLDNSDFWRAMDIKEDTALYTADKIRNLFSDLSEDYNNDDLKDIFKEVSTTEAWKFVQESDIVTYYYFDYSTVGELLQFIENIEKAFNMAWPLTLSNRYS